MEPLSWPAWPLPAQAVPAAAWGLAFSRTGRAPQPKTRKAAFTTQGHHPELRKEKAGQDTRPSPTRGRRRPRLSPRGQTRAQRPSERLLRAPGPARGSPA